VSDTTDVAQGTNAGHKKILQLILKLSAINIAAKLIVMWQRDKKKFVKNWFTAFN
jgi:hypothetical protein